MNRTALFLAAAVALSLVALIVGAPRHGAETLPPTTPTPVVRPPEVVAPTRAADGSLTMTSRLSHPLIQTGQSDVFVTVDVQGAEVPGAKRAPVNLALVIDRSGSMSGFKLQQAKQAARQLVSELSDNDRLAIVHYGSDVKSLEGLYCSGTNKARLLRYIDGIVDDGGTNIGAGLTTGRDQLLRSMSDFKVNRLVLISDGQPTEGLQDQGALTNLTKQIRAHGISVTSIGVGTDFNEDLMQAIAEVGAGAYAYLQDASQLSTIFKKDLNQAGTQVAHAVTLSFKLPPGTRLGEVLGYRTAFADERTVTVDLPDFAAGQLERVVARLTVDAPLADTTFEVTGLTLAYSDLLKSQPVASNAQLSATSTASAERVMKNRDPQAMVFATRARAAVNTQLAAQALKDGNQGRADELLGRNQAAFEEAAQAFGPSSVAADIASNDDLRQAFQGANTATEQEAQSKTAKRKARIDFGLMGSSY